jgi:cell wall-associated NlpC family hydrolase
VTRADVVTFGRTWLGVPWVHQGRSRQGVDCAGLLEMIGREFGMEVPAKADYPRTADGVSLRATLERFVRPIAVRAMQPADVVLLHFPRADHESHLALVVDHPQRGLGLLHALNERSGRGRVIEHGLDATWRSRIVAAFALPGVE